MLLTILAVAASTVLDFNPQNEVLPALLSARRNAAAYNNPNPPSSVTLLQCTDIHGCAENLERIVTFYDAYKAYIDDAIHTGDVVSCFWDDPQPYDAVAGAEKIMNIPGNHDCWKGHLGWEASGGYPYDANQQDTYTTIIEKYVANWNVVQPQGVKDKRSEHYRACYYYKDYPAATVRLVALDCMHYTEIQNKWFSEVLSDACAKGLTVICAIHYASQCGVDEFADSPFTQTGYKIHPAEPQEGVQFCRTPSMAYDAVDKFMDNGGQFAAWVSGDEHHDCMGTVKGHPRQLSATMDKSGDGDIYMTEDRTPGTRNQDSFNLITVNPSKHIIVIQRIGCQYDCKMRRHTIFCYDYVEGKILAEY